MELRAVKPKFGDNYAPGFIGFTFVQDSLISKGIAYFAHWHRLSEIKVSHALIVSGENECIEAHAPKGVVRSSLNKYFDDPHCAVFFRKPVGWTPEMGERIVKAASACLGFKYDFALIAARFLADNRIGYWLNSLLHHAPDYLVTRLLDNRRMMICSELASHALNRQPELAGKGILARPPAMIEPQALFEDRVIFEPWKAQALRPEQLTLRLAGASR